MPRGLRHPAATILPRVLVVDDQYARDADSWRSVKQTLGLVEATDPAGAEQPLAEVVLCSGQRTSGGAVENVYDVIADAVRAGDPQSWALVLVDAAFLSGELQPSGAPKGRPGDETFGEQAYARLSEDFPGLPLVQLTTREQQDLTERHVSYLAKTRLTRKELGKKLVQRGRLTVTQKRSVLGLWDDIVAEAPATLAVFQDAYLLTQNKLSVLILGPTGVGKEILAAYIHRISDRSSGPYIKVNVKSIPKDQMEAELFGIAANAATGVGARPGRFEEADGGTLFLDEIGDMPPDMQAAILRTLEDGVITRTGLKGSVEADVRLVCATNHDVIDLVERGKFRTDLYMRINAVPINIVELRYRGEDIPKFVDLFLRKAMEQEGKIGIRFSPEARRLIESQPFPGNARELRNLIGRLVAGAGHNELIDEETVAGALLQAGGRLYEVRGHDAAPPPGPTEPRAVSVPLRDLPHFLDKIRIRIEDNKSLMSVLPALQGAYQTLLRRVAGAALERTADPLTGKMNKQRAMRLLSGDEKLRAKAPDRLINTILDRRHEAPVTEADLQGLVTEWQNHGRDRRE